jgi:O-antigen ligase
MNALPLHFRLASIFCVGVGMALLTTVAGTNIMVLLLLLVAPWAWVHYKMDEEERQQTCLLWAMVLALCAWSMLSDFVAGHQVKEVVKALLHDMRTFAFIVLLWPVFTTAHVSRTALWTLLGSVLALATANLFLTIGGYLPPGEYFWPTAPHLYGQILVGFFFLLAQMLLVRPSLSWRVSVPMALLLMSLFFASERRTGYLQLAAGFVLWAGLNHKRLLVGKYKWWFVLGAVAAFAAAVASPIVQRRMAQVAFEVQQFLAQTPEERTAKETAVGIRLQYYVSVWQLIKQSNFWVGVGSINFPDLFWQVNEKMGGTEKTLFSNPHNEYLYTLATKGIVGLALYLAVFVQASRMAWKKVDEVQRVGLVMFVFLFMLSITTNSMMIDMEEGHFTMLVLLMFLAPKSLALVSPETQNSMNLETVK